MNNIKPIDIENWSTDDWETYLSSLEAPQREKLLDNPQTVENMNSDYYLENFSSLIGQNYTPQLKELCGSILDRLTPHQQKIITEIYWNNKNAEELGRELGVSGTAVRRVKERAETQMKKYILNLQENQNQEIEQDNEEAS